MNRLTNSDLTDFFHGETIDGTKIELSAKVGSHYDLYAYLGRRRKLVRRFGADVAAATAAFAALHNASILTVSEFLAEHLLAAFRAATRCIAGFGTDEDYAVAREHDLALRQSDRCVMTRRYSLMARYFVPHQLAGADA
jgi:hypothetical protein